MVYTYVYTTNAKMYYMGMGKCQRYWLDISQMHIYVAIINIKCNPQIIVKYFHTFYIHECFGNVLIIHGVAGYSSV